MKIWVSGAAGMLGTHLLNLLNQKYIPHIGTDIQTLDITNLDQIISFISQEQITHIINCSAYTQVDKAEREPEKAFAVNVLGPKNLGLASSEHQIPIIHFSTDYIFDGLAKTPYREEDTANPLSIYGKTKFEGEDALLASTNLACIIRTSWLFGLYGNNFVRTMLKLMGEKETLSIVSDQIGRPTFARDLAEIALRLLECKGVFHFANSTEISWHGFAEQIYKTATAKGIPLKVKELLPIQTEDYPTEAKRPKYSTLCTKKIEDFLAYKPRSLVETLEEYIIEDQYVTTT